MGAGIAEVCAVGVPVTLVDIDKAAVDAGVARITKSLDSRVRKGRLTAESAQTTLDNLRTSTAVSDLAAADLVIEVVVESLPVKQELFRDLDDLLQPTAILASNTSSLPVISIAKGTSRPDRVIGLHFFNPPPALDLIELTSSVRTDPLVADEIASWFADTLQRRVIRSGDRAGFVVNALLVPYLLSAVRMLESGFASRDDIDAGMMRGCGHPMGPLQLLDLIGLDTMVLVADGLYDEWQDKAMLAPVLLRRMVDGGMLGRKSGHGFYDYSSN